jgi:DNA-binding NarL/FixJ family response regulator
VSALEATGDAGRAALGQPAALLICTPIRLFREGLATVLGGAAGVRVVGTAADRAGALAEARAHPCTAVLIDIGMPDAVPTIRQLTAELRHLRVIALGVTETETAVIACAEAGVAALVTADESLDDLLATVAATVRGDAPCSPRLAGILLRRVAALAGERHAPERTAVHLTERERQILGLMAEGLSNKQIGQRLWIELPTVKNHVHRILEKLAVSRRAEAVAWLHANERV